MSRSLLYCPLEVPLGIFVLPKSGSTAAQTWAAMLDEEAVWGRLMQLGKAAKRDWDMWKTQGRQMTSPLPGGKELPDNEEEKVARLFGESSSVRAELKQQALGIDCEFKYTELGKRWLRRIGMPTALTRQLKMQKTLLLLPPPQRCTMCCLAGQGRIRVVVARHPFARLFSYFREEMRLNPNETTEILRRRMSLWPEFVRSVSRIPGRLSLMDREELHAAQNELAPLRTRLMHQEEYRSRNMLHFLHHTRPALDWLTQWWTASNLAGAQPGNMAREGGGGGG